MCTSSEFLRRNMLMETLYRLSLIVLLKPNALIRHCLGKVSYGAVLG